MDTASLKGSPPMNHLLQGLHIIYANFASYFSIVGDDKDIREIEVPLGFVLSSTSSLDIPAFYL